MRRRPPYSPSEILLRASITLASLFFLYATTVHMLERLKERNSKHSQQSTPKPSTPAPMLRTHPPELSEADIQRQREIAEAMAARRAAEQKKQAAWAQFYQPPRPCFYPESSQRAAVCQANEQKQREAFELAWAQQAQQ